MAERSLSHRSKSRLTAGIVLLLIGGIALAYNLGVDIPTGWWRHLPWLLIVLGGVQLAWPGGSFRERVGGYWLVVVGIYALVCIYRVLGLFWISAAPIFVIALGLRVILGGLFRHIDIERTKTVEK